MAFPYVYLDATFLHVREHHQVTSKAVVIATGVSATEYREILGIDVGDSENEVFWREFLRKLRAWGLEGVQLVISDQHAGLVSVIKRCVQGASHQRCRVYFARNLLAMIPEGHQPLVSAAFKTVFAQVSGEDMHAQWNQVVTTFEDRFPKGVALMTAAKWCGQSLRKSQAGSLWLDRGYDSTLTRLAERGIDDAMIAKTRKRGTGTGTKRQPMGLRWPVERTKPWLSNFGQLRRNTDRFSAHRLAQFALAVALIITFKLVEWVRRWGSMAIA